MRQGGTPQTVSTFAAVDLWASVSTAALPSALVDSIERSDWSQARVELQSQLDSLNTDGIHGRSLLQLARRLPLGIDPVFDRYRASVAIDYGDWDDLRRCMAAAPIGAGELEMARSTFLSAVSEEPKVATTSPLEALFLPDELLISSRMGWLRQWARRLPSMDATGRFSRPDIPAGRHFRVRQLHHAALLAAAESHAGSLETAAALGHEAMRLGDEGEPLRDIASDIRSATLVAMGEGAPTSSLKLFERTGTAQGLSPLGTFQWIHYLSPFLPLFGDGAVRVSAEMLQRIASRFGSPKMQLIAEAWVVAAQVLEQSGERTDLRALLSSTRRAGVGLRVLPELLNAFVSRRYSGFQESERLARQAGMVWAQVVALIWMTALDPSPRASRNLLRLLTATGWRRPVFVPDTVVADAVVGMVASGVRGQAIVELALAGKSVTIAADIAMAHASDQRLPSTIRAAAIEALGKIGTSHSRRLMEQLARGGDDTGAAAKAMLAPPSRAVGLTDREAEVIDLVGRGMTNREIAARLSLSHHTVARHLSNARDKLGAVNRADAAVRLGRLNLEQRTVRR